MNIEEELKLLIQVISDLKFEREIIIVKYVLPLLSDMSEIIPRNFFKLDNLSKVFPNCLGDIMNLMNIEHISSMLEMNNLNITADEFVTTDWESFNNLEECEFCNKIDVLLKCEDTHHEECFNSLFETFCGKNICDNCVGINCEVVDDGCKVVRCISCYEKDS